MINAVTIVAVLLCWHAFSGGQANATLPQPLTVLRSLIGMTTDGTLASDILASLRRAGAGYFIGAFLGISLGVLAGQTKIGDATVGIIVQLLRPIPVVAIVPIAIVWFGLGEGSKVFLVAYGTFFPVWLNTYLGVQQVNPQMAWAAASLGASRSQIILFVVLPAASSHVIAGLRTAIATAFICLVSAEMAGAFAGVGYRVEESYLIFRNDRMLGSMLILGILGATCDGAFAFLIRRFAPWYNHPRH